MNSSLVYIIVLNWNGKHLLYDCLNTLMKVKYDNYIVLLVDNASTDGSVDYVRNEFPDIDILGLDKNYGFAGGNNKGFEYAKRKNAEYVIFLNNDTFVDPNFISPLLIPFNNRHVGQTVPKIFYADEKDKIWYAGGKINFWTGYIYHEGIRELDSEKYGKIKQTDYATGCCFCIRVSDFEQLHGFDETFAMYAEDADISLRIRKLGKKVMFSPKSIIWHKVSSSIGGAFSPVKIKRKVLANMKLMFKYSQPYQWLTQLICFPFLIIIGSVKYLKYK